MTNLIRRSALTLHALKASDRAWILERLDPQSRRDLSLMLDEISNLGVPSDARLIEEALADEGRVASSDERLEWSSIDPLDVFAVLAEEPAEVVAAFANTIVWPHTAELISMFPDDQQRRIRQHLQPGAAVGPAFRSALTRALSRRLTKGTRSNAGVRGHSSFLRRITRRSGSRLFRQRSA